MQLTDKMEELSVGFIEAIANSQGYFSMYGRDSGTDMHFRKAISRSISQTTKLRYLTSGKQIDAQVKSAYERNTSVSNGNIVYNLKINNYNDLVTRANENPSLIPLILILFIFPDNDTNWISLSNNELILRKCAYWYTMPPGLSESDNSTGQTIYVPESNVIGSTFFDDIFRHFWP